MKRRSSSSPVALLGTAGRRTLIALAATSAVKAGGLVLVAEGITRGVIAIIDGTNDARSAVLVALFGGILRAIAAWTTRTVAQRGSRGEKSEIRERLARRILTGEQEGGGAVAVLGTRGLDDLDGYFVTFLPAFIAAIIVPPIIGLRILFADPVSAVVIVLTIPLVPIFMILIGRHTKDRTEKAMDALLRLSAHLAELARGLPVLVGLGRANDQTAALRGLSDDYARRTQKTLRTAFLSSLAMELIATISVAVVAVFIGVRLVYGGMELEAGLLVLILAAECYLPLREAGAAYHSSEDGLAALQRVQETLDAQPAESLWVGKHEGTIRVRALSVQFPGRAALFRGFGMDAPQGMRTLLQGASGAGKTTLLRLIAGRATPGAVSGLISGVPTERIAWASQHPQFFEDTAVAELLLHAPGEEAYARAVLAEVGLEGSADQSIVSLSPGQQRRVAVARALWRVDRGAQLLLLDEPTAHLDDISADAVRAALARRTPVTMIIASHDPRMQAFCDHRVPLDSSRPAATVDNRDEDAPAEPDLPQSHEGREMPEQRSVRGALRSIFAARPWSFAFAIALGLLATAFSVAQTALSGWLIVRAAEQPPILLLTVAIVGVRFFGLGRAVLRYAERLELHRVVFALAGNLRLRLWRVLASAGLRLPGLRKGPAALELLVGDIDEVRDEIPRVIAPPLIAALSQIALLIVTALLVPSAVLPLCLLFVVTMVVAPALAWRLDAKASRQEQEDRAAVARSFTGLAEAAEELAVHGATTAPLRHLRLYELAALQSARQAANAGGIGQAISIFAVVVAAAGIIVTGAGNDGALIALVALATLSLGEPAAEAVTAVQRGPALHAAAQRIDAVLALSDAELPAPVRQDPESDDAAALVLRDVSARWPNSSRPVFTGLSLHAERGEWLSVIGRSGSGKSTLLAVFMGHLPAITGEVLVRGQTPRSAAPGIIAWCPQEGHLFDSTLRANLLLARSREDKPTEEEMIDALGKVGLSEWFGTLEDGLNTRIGASGGFLSGGQRQRIAVARTLLTGADIVLLDEPTAHLDRDGAEHLIRDLRVGLSDRLVICVTHDHALLKVIVERPGARVLRMGERTQEAPLFSGAS